MGFVRLLVMSFLWKGVLGAKQDYYKVNITAEVTAQEGLCVLIPCEFTYEDTREKAASPSGYWFIDGKPEDKAVASNNETKTIHEDALGRFKLVGDVTRRDCSLSINGVSRWDGRTYYFRYQHSNSSKIKWSYKLYPLRITVVDRQDKPKISLPQRVMADELITVKCTSPVKCSDTAPKITWGPGSQFKLNESNDDVMDGNQTYKSTFTFSALKEHNNKSLYCEAYFPAVNISNSVSLNVEYPPDVPQISIHKTQDIPMKISNGSSVVVLEGSDCTLQCTVDSNPLSNLTWIKGENSLIESVFSSKSLELIFPDVTYRDEGAYHCEAVNKHGQKKNLIKVTVEYPPRTPQIKVENVTTPDPPKTPQIKVENVTIPDWSRKQENFSIKKVLEGRSVNIHCSVESSPLSNLTWIKGEKTILGKENIDKLAISISNVTFENEGHYWCFAKNIHGMANSSIFIRVERTDSTNIPLMPMIGGAVAGVVALAGVCLLAWGVIYKVRRTRCNNEKASDEKETVGDVISIYSVVKKTPKGPRTKNNPCSGANAMDSKEEDLYANFSNDNLQYAKVQFSQAKPQSKPIPPPEEILYSEVKVHKPGSKPIPPPEETLYSEVKVH